MSPAQVGKGRGRNYSSHMPVLIEVLARTRGPVLECGGGRYSTPFLHWACKRQGRLLVTLEASPKYYDYAKQWVDDHHQVLLVEDWDACPLLDEEWDVVFIDHDGPRRARDAVRVAQRAKYVVLHDTCGRDEKNYHYREITYPHYKYTWQYTEVRPRTSVVSNFVDVRGMKVGP